MNKPQLIVALDVDTLEEAQKVVETLGKNVQIYKVGSQLFTACGPDVVRYLMKQGKKIFLDLKFHDIPNTVANAVRSALLIREGQESIFMLTLHTVGGKEMLEAAAKAAREAAENLKTQKPLLVAVTVLTSDTPKDNIRSLILERAKLAQESGLDGVVASAQEAALIREKFGKDFVIVTPGIRSQGQDPGDQKRVTTPVQAIKNGSDFLVVGRPIVEARDPLKAAREILQDIQKVLGDSRYKT